MGSLPWTSPLDWYIQFESLPNLKLEWLVIRSCRLERNSCSRFYSFDLIVCSCILVDLTKLFENEREKQFYPSKNRNCNISNISFENVTINVYKRQCLCLILVLFCLTNSAVQLRWWFCWLLDNPTGYSTGYSTATSHLSKQKALISHTVKGRLKVRSFFEAIAISK